MASSSSAHVLSAIQGTVSDVIPVRRVLVSVFDKTGIVEFCQYLVASAGVTEILSTGGTAAQLKAAGLPVTDVSSYTKFPECLNGRVKTLHPLVHGGLLAVRGNKQHEEEMAANGILPIDMTILNLYPFAEAVQKYKGDANEFEQCIENIDIGGPSMLRSTAKNHAYTCIVTSPTQYETVKECLQVNEGGTTLALRRSMAAAAFSVSAGYDAMIAEYFMNNVEAGQPQVVTRIYEPQFPLKYGCNPQQTPASILSRSGKGLPFTVLNGKPGYINLLDAANAWQLVVELRAATGLPAATSFKHVSPAGAGLAIPLTETEIAAYEIADPSVLTDTALAYVRARNADPMCSFGDFCAVSEVVDEATANVLKKEVSDGIVALGYTPQALEILKSKKGGKFIILEAVPDYDAGETEYREVYGMTFEQKRNTALISSSDITSNIKTAKNDLPTDAVRDLILASICIKYTQSNSVGFAKNGMMVGVGAGQQSRVDCVKLAGRKVATWMLRQHPKVLGLQFKSGVKRQDRVNARVRYIEGDFTTPEKKAWETLFEKVPDPLLEDEKHAFLDQASGVSLSSDAFFPFRDSIDHASKLGVSYVVQPGGSVQDKAVTDACDEYKMAMSFTGVRLFHH